MLSSGSGLTSPTEKRSVVAFSVKESSVFSVVVAASVPVSSNSATRLASVHDDSYTISTPVRYTYTYYSGTPATRRDFEACKGNKFHLETCNGKCYIIVTLMF